MNLAPGFLTRGVPQRARTLTLQLRHVTREFQDSIGNHQSQLARLLKVKPQTVQGWFKLGRISAWGAIEIPKHFPAWTKERLRPDIIDWKSIKLRVPGRL